MEPITCVHQIHQTVSEDLRSQKDRQRPVGKEYLCSCNSATTAVVILSVQSVFGHLESIHVLTRRRSCFCHPFCVGNGGVCAEHRRQHRSLDRRLSGSVQALKWRLLK